MSELKGQGGPGRGQGRHPKPKELKRVRCGDITLPTWLHDWLMSQDKPAGHIVEAALIEKHNLTPPPRSKQAVARDRRITPFHARRSN